MTAVIFTSFWLEDKAYTPFSLSLLGHVGVNVISNFASGVSALLLHFITRDTEKQTCLCDPLQQ